MALVLKDRVQESATAPGTGTVTLGGAALGYQTFSSSIGNGNTTFYCIADQGGAKWEVGLGTVGAGTLARTTVYANYLGTTALVNFSSGTQTVFVTYPAEQSVNLDASNNVSPLGTIASGTWNATAITTTYGGTGLTSYTAGDLPYYTSGTALSKLAIGTNGYVLTSNGTAPVWSANTAATADDAYFLSFMMG